jgi:hypothetical protein
MRLLSALSGALLATISIVSEAHACSCSGGAPESWAGRADAVFLGHPVAVGPAVLSEFGGIVTTFAVDSVWKGDVRRRVVVVTDLSSCGGYFPSGETFLVFARRNRRGRLQTKACTGTGPASSSARAFAVLGPGAPPRPRSWLPLAAALAGALAAVALSLGFAKRRRGRSASPPAT